MQRRGSEILGLLALVAVLLGSFVLLSSPDVLFAQVFERQNMKCTGNATGCCNHANGCVDQIVQNACPGGGDTRSIDYEGKAYYFCETFQGETCQESTVQCCEKKFYWEDDCAELACTTHTNGAGCTPPSD